MALGKYKVPGNAIGEAAQYSSLGFIKGDQGEFDLAVDYFNQAKDIYEERGDQINAVTQMIRWGHVRMRGRCLAIKKYLKAIYHRRKSPAIGRQKIHELTTKMTLITFE